MKPYHYLQHIVVLLLLSLSLAISTRTAAQALTTLHSFSSTPGVQSGTNSDGANPFHALVLAGNTLYGTTTYGGGAGGGNVFKVNTDGTGFNVVHDFMGYKNSDALGPYCGLVLSGNTLYGTTMDGGLSFPVVFGTVFAVNTDGTGLTILHAFDHLVGHTPEGGLVLSGNTLYGTTYDTIFSINTDGTGFAILHTASGTDGVWPLGGLVLSGNTLYGTTYSGGTWSNGTVYACNVDGSSYTLLHSFEATSGSVRTNSDGANPIAGLVLSEGVLYGTATYGGPSGAGTVFSLRPDGSEFKVLHNFNGTDSGAPFELLIAGNTVYGTASPAWPNGMLFSMSTDGSGFTTLCNINPGSGTGGLLLTNNAIYGVTYYGGTAGTGSIFRFSLMPTLTLTPSGSNVVLTWPTSATGFTLQSATSLASPTWSTVSTAAIVVNGQNTVTNPISGTQQFFRLSQ